MLTVSLLDTRYFFFCMYSVWGIVASAFLKGSKWQAQHSEYCVQGINMAQLQF